MEHNDVLKQILKNLSSAVSAKHFRIPQCLKSTYKCGKSYRLKKFHWRHNNFHKLEIDDAFSEEVQSSVYTSLTSLYRILSNYSPNFNSETEDQMKLLECNKNFSKVKPSFNELRCMCERNLRLFPKDSREYKVIFEFAHYMRILDFDRNNDAMQQVWENHFSDTCFSFEADILPRYYEFGFVFYAFFYFYLFLVLEKEGLIYEEFKPWEVCLVNNWIYLPLEGTVNLVYFNYLINPHKDSFSEFVTLDGSERDANTLCQYDCGFISNNCQKLSLNQHELIFLLDATQYNGNNKADEGQIKKYVNTPVKWLKCFHVVTKKANTFNATLLKLIKALYDIEENSAIEGLCAYEDYSAYKVLANVDECNFTVRGILYKNIFGNVSTCIKSTVFRDLPLSTIWELEHLHDTVMDHLGNFAKRACDVWFTDENTDDKYKENLLVDLMAKIDNYQFKEEFKDDFKDNALVQIVAWLFLAEIYAYLKTEVIISDYMNSHIQAINDSRGYCPKEVPTDLNVVFEDLSIYRNKGNSCFTNTNFTLDHFYRMHAVFDEENIPELIENTRTAMLYFFADTLLFIKHPQNCSLRQFLAVSLILVKTKKGSSIFPKIPEFNHYGHATQRLSVHEYLKDTTGEYSLKRVLFASKLFEHQMHAFIQTSRHDLYYKLIIASYKKIMNYLDEKIPIIKDGRKSHAEKAEKTLSPKFSSYQLLMSVYDITVNLFDKLLDDIP
ncbi:MAG: hypothetical protein NC299_16575 [Lachnospiraceae bacterium]|nr:hypothetical protein [Ruminococcus sp.]MCM1276952.1 hypothetical protein [Lachnospiraceae bacterium]